MSEVKNDSIITYKMLGKPHTINFDGTNKIKGYTKNKDELGIIDIYDKDLEIILSIPKNSIGYSRVIMILEDKGMELLDKEVFDEFEEDEDED